MKAKADVLLHNSAHSQTFMSEELYIRTTAIYVTTILFLVYSALWPFSTLGWPDVSAEDFKRFYPTTMLETG